MQIHLHVCISDKRWGVMFADTLTRLFEDTARIVEDCHLVVETAYGM